VTEEIPYQESICAGLRSKGPKFRLAPAAVTEDVSDFPDATRRVGKQYGRARDAAAEAYDEMYDQTPQMRTSRSV
jgi:hypothetical protein